MRDKDAEQLWHRVSETQIQLKTISDELARMMGGMTPEAFGILNYIPGLQEKSKANPLTVAEIGVYKADTTVQLLRHLNIKKYYAIDPWEYDLQNSEISAVKDTIANRDVCAYVEDRLQDYDNVQIIKKRSADALDDIENNSLDFCFIDGDHDGQAVYDDIMGYLGKVKPGGIVAGDDWHWESVRAGIFAALKINLHHFKAPIEQNAVAKSRGVNLAYDFRGTYKLWYLEKGDE